MTDGLNRNQGRTPDIQDFPEMQERMALPGPVRLTRSHWRQLINDKPTEAAARKAEVRLGSREMWRIIGLWSVLIEQAYSHYVAACKQYGVEPESE